MKASDLFVKCLEAEGIEYIFGGPGATNLIAGVADANMDRAPMPVLAGNGCVRKREYEKLSQRQGEGACSI